jgi:hypothetical protein
MSLVTLATARLHLRHDSGTTEDDLITLWLAVAEAQVAEYLNRNVYADGAALLAAQAAAPTALEAAEDAFDAVLVEIAALTDDLEYATRKQTAEATYRKAREDYAATMQGIVVNDSIQAAVLLLLAYLFENRAPQYGESSLEKAAPVIHQRLLAPYRVQMGI